MSRANRWRMITSVDRFGSASRLRCSDGLRWLVLASRRTGGLPKSTASEANLQTMLASPIARAGSCGKQPLWIASGVALGALPVKAAPAFRCPLPSLVESMQANGWEDTPIDVVWMPDGELTAVDNTRLMAAGLTGTPVLARVRGCFLP